MGVSTVRLWAVHFSSTDSNSGSALLVQIVTSTARRLLLTAGEKTQLTMVTVEKPCFVAENLPNSVIVLFAFVVVSLEINRRPYFQSNLCIYSQLNRMIGKIAKIRS